MEQYLIVVNVLQLIDPNIQLNRSEQQKNFA
jgi:hypothetical protein